MNFLLAWAWIVLVPIAVYTGWVYSLAFISACSLYANAAAHGAAWRADVPMETQSSWSCPRCATIDDCAYRRDIRR